MGLTKNEKTSRTLKQKAQEVDYCECEFCGKIFLNSFKKNSHRTNCSKNPKKIQRDERKLEKISELLNSANFDDIPQFLRKDRILLEQNNSCAKCGLKEWLGEIISFELEHRDGDRNNNVRENLELLCPNCHSMTDTWRGRNKRKQGRISDSELLKSLQSTSSIRQALIKVGLAGKGKNYLRCKRLLESSKIEIDKGL